MPIAVWVLGLGAVYFYAALCVAVGVATAMAIKDKGAGTVHQSVL